MISDRWPTLYVDGPDLLGRRRPPCPKCEMRMIASDPASDTFECMRCGTVAEVLPAINANQQAAE
jgi:tRNA(Ile2) C34 agmatinyltransferase TiaS